MKSFFLLLFTLLLSIFHLRADHIVGGELQFQHKNGIQYYIGLNFYFNDITGDPLAKDAVEQVSIFRKRDNLRLTTLIIGNISDDFIPNSGPNCANGDVRTRLIRYGSIVTLDPKIYNDIEGYYISWERCCRNHTIDNIEDPDATGITIYLEFPALLPSGTRLFINSSPIFKSLKNVYGCTNSPFYYDFGATDDDGDSLVYSLKTPLKGHSTDVQGNIAPVGNPAPYDSVLWKSGYDLANAIPGNPSLKIDKTTGQLFAIPSMAGLYVFSVACEEYRKGKKIGMVLRDFQFLIENCPPMYPPKISLPLGNNTFYTEGDTIELELKKNYCYNLSTTDSTWEKLNTEETLHFIGSGKSQNNIFTSFDPSTLQINEANPIGQNSFCISTSCNSGENNYAGYYKYQIIASDNSCPLPMMDTLDITFYIKPLVNNPPQIFPDGSLTVNLTSEDTYSLSIYGTDQDSLDQLDLIMLSEGGTATSMSFPNVHGTDSIGSIFNWTPTCDDLKQSDHYYSYFIVKDNHCLYPYSDTLLIDFNLTKNVYPFTFSVPNLITPNGDSHNQFFEIPDMPKDNCDNFFVNIEIFNRWGSKVFESKERSFSWDAANESEGLYFYSINYSSKKYKSWVEIIK